MKVGDQDMGAALTQTGPSVPASRRAISLAFLPANIVLKKHTILSSMSNIRRHTGADLAYYLYTPGEPEKPVRTGQPRMVERQWSSSFVN
jgi:hypothetical protein